MRIPTIPKLPNIPGVAPIVVPPAANYSLLFDGANDKGSLADGSGYEGLAEGSIEFFFKTSFGDGYQKIFAKGGVIDIGISQNFGGGAKLFGEIAGVANFGEITGNVATGAWHFAAICWDDTSIECYFNGTRVFNDAVSGAQSTSSDPLLIGTNGGTELLNGRLGPVRFSDIKRYTGASMDVPTEPFADDANALIIWNMVENTGNPQDISGNGRHLVLDGTTPPAWDADSPFA